MKIQTLAAVTAATLIIGFVGVTTGYGITLQPGEDTSEDVFVYEGMPTFNMDGAPFGGFLATSENSIGHITRSLIRFDLSGVPLSPAELTQATLSLYVTDGSAFGGAFADPSPAAPVDLAVRGLGGSWDESAVSWLTQPAALPGDPEDTVMIDGIYQWISLDVTGLVAGFLRDPGDPDYLENFGFQLAQVSEVIDPDSGARVGVVYESAAGANRPYLTLVPEPATAGLLLFGALVGLRRRR